MSFKNKQAVQVLWQDIWREADVVSYNLNNLCYTLKDNFWKNAMKSYCHHNVTNQLSNF